MILLLPINRSSNIARFINSSSSEYRDMGSNSIISRESLESYLPRSSSEIEDIGKYKSKGTYKEG